MRKEYNFYKLTKLNEISLQCNYYTTAYALVAQVRLQYKKLCLHLKKIRKTNLLILTYFYETKFYICLLNLNTESC